jgi:predicted phosphodiesterase
VFAITGDTHGEIDIGKLNTKKFPEQKIMTKSDYLIICGDFGCIWSGDQRDEYWLKWLNEKPFTTLFVDGNHENFSILNTYPVVDFYGGKAHQVKPSVYHLMRGEVFEINGKKIFAMGGASSHDKEHRREGISWWPEELPSDAEYDHALETLDKHNWCVDMVISHCAPDSMQKQVADWYEHDKLTNFLQIVKHDLIYGGWYFGHYHVDKRLTGEGMAMYKEIVIKE